MRCSHTSEQAKWSRLFQSTWARQWSKACMSSWVNTSSIQPCEYITFSHSTTYNGPVKWLYNIVISHNYCIWLADTPSMKCLTNCSLIYMAYKFGAYNHQLPYGSNGNASKFSDCLHSNLSYIATIQKSPLNRLSYWSLPFKCTSRAFIDHIYPTSIMSCTIQSSMFVMSNTTL